MKQPVNVILKLMTVFHGFSFSNIIHFVFQSTFKLIFIAKKMNSLMFSRIM